MGPECSCDNCSALKYEDYNASGEFDGDLDGFKVVTSENELPDILEVLGDGYANGSSGFPILRWMVRDKWL